MSEQTMSYKCLVGIEEKCTFWDRSENKCTNPNFEPTIFLQKYSDKKELVFLNCSLYHHKFEDKK